MLIVVHWVLLTWVIVNCSAHVGDRNRHNWWQRWDNQGCEVLLVNCSVRMTDYKLMTGN